ncbi:MAG TPA: PAS domain S-box protein [Acidocella sp.]|nr:PAS domain S-box protein [Acidocella sp.]
MTDAHHVEPSLMDDHRYRLLVDSVTDYAIFMLDPDGLVTTWNPGAQRFHGYRASEIIGKHFSLFYTPEDQAAGMPARVLQIVAADGRFETEGWRVRKDNTRFWAHVIIDRIKTADGNIAGYAKVTRDLTEKKRAEEALRCEEQQFRILVQGVSDYSIYMLSPDGRVVNWNLGAQRIYGYRPEEIIGRSFSNFYTDEDLRAGLPARALETAVREGRFEREGWRIRKDGRRFLANVMIDPIRDKSGEIIGFAKITRDVTEQKETRCALEEAREALFQAQKMEAIGQLTGGIAHDFNNLLTGILGSLELIETRLAQGRIKELDRYIDIAQGSAKRAAALTSRLLAFSRRQTLTPKPVDIIRLVSGLEDLLRRTAGPTIELSVRIPENVWAILVDPNQLENALLNLCINAHDAMQDGGRLTITARNWPSDSQPENEHDLPAGDWVIISVTDTGTGMPKEVIERAFEPFFTTKPLGEGTGLGLSMIHGFAHQSGGKVWIESEIGQGTQVHLCLPRYSGENESTQPSLGPVGHHAFENETVLVVDDEPFIRMLITETLADLGYRYIEAEDGLSGLKCLETEQKLDLLITDIGLPGGLNGRQLADAGLLLRPGLKVLFITGHAHGAIFGKDDLPPNVHILTKPFTLEQLKKCIATIFRR